MTNISRRSAIRGAVGLAAASTLARPYIANAQANAPLSDRVALYTSLTYMHQSAAAGGEGSAEDAWNFTIGISFYPGANARSRTVAGQCWMPQLPVAPLLVPALPPGMPTLPVIAQSA